MEKGEIRSAKWWGKRRLRKKKAGNENVSKVNKEKLRGRRTAKEKEQIKKGREANEGNRSLTK